MYSASNGIRAATLGLFWLAAINVVAIVCLGGYDFFVGSLHFTASDFFKPLLLLNGAFLVVLASNPRISSQHAPKPCQEGGVTSPGYLILGTLITVALYFVSIRINLEFPDWTHRVTTDGHSIFSFFVQRQYDGFYRPLGFISLWIDNRVFGDLLWVYHLQNLVLHLLNGILVARLAYRFGLSREWAQRAGILFLVLPPAFEAVIWPGARFDLLAASFTLLALERALAGSIVFSTIVYALGVLSKEIAYCYPITLAALYIWRSRMAFTLDSRRFRAILGAAAAVTVLLVGVRFLVYGSLGGYPDPATGDAVQFQISLKSFTSLVSRVPGSLYLMNSDSCFSLLARAAVLLYVSCLIAVVRGGVRLGRRSVWVAMPFLAAIPMVNMIAWVNHFAQQGRYLYIPGVWCVVILGWVLAHMQRGRITMVALAASMAVAAWLNMNSYQRMARIANIAAVAAANECESSSCCRSLLLQGMPANLYGAFYFRYQVWSEAKRLLPGVNVLEPDQTAQTSPCTVILRWTPANVWVPGN